MLTVYLQKDVVKYPFGFFSHNSKQKTMKFQKYSSFVKPSDVSKLNRMYVEFITHPKEELGVTKRRVDIISEFLFGQKDIDFELDVLRNTVFSDNQIKFIELAESLDETVFYRLNKYNHYEPWISVMCPVEIEEGDEPTWIKFKNQAQEQGIHFWEDSEVPRVRGLYNGKWEEFVNIIAVQ